jgi:hypothetical protein
MGSLVSGAIGLIGAEKAEDQSYAAGNELKALGREASGLAGFKPFGITGSALGTPQFTYDSSGKLTGGSYGAAPQLTALQNQLLGGLSGYNPQALGQTASALTPASQQLFSLGKQYLGQTPQELEQNYVKSQLGLLQPGFEQAAANLRNSQYQTGRSGLGTGGTVSGYGVGTPGLAQTNPDQAAFANAYARAVADITARAPQAAREQLAFGADLFGTGSNLLGKQSTVQTAGYAPIQAALQTSQATEALLSSPFAQSLNLANLQSTAGANQGRLLTGPVTAGINTQLEGQQALTNAQYGFYGDLAGAALGSFGF